MKNKTKAATTSASVSIAVIALMTIIGELVSPFKDFLASIPPVYHHWVTKGVFSFILFIALFFILGTVFGEEKSGKPQGVMATVVVTVLSGLAILIFYVIHFFG